MWLTCEHCGKLYLTYMSPRCKHHYCSRECSYSAKSTKQKFCCALCGKDIYRAPYEHSKSGNYFCSTKCFNDWQGRNKVRFICKTCGKEFFRSKSWTTEKMGYYCSIECRNMDSEWVEHTTSNANMIQCKKRGLNKLEIKGSEILDKLNLPYNVQYLINNKICVDVYIHSHNLIIQWDGNYWHGKNKTYDELDERVKKRVDLDKSQDAYFKKCGFVELRFWEDDVMERSDFVYETIVRTIQQSTE